MDRRGFMGWCAGAVAAVPLLSLLVPDEFTTEQNREADDPQHAYVGLPELGTYHDVHTRHRLVRYCVTPTGQWREWSVTATYRRENPC